MEAVIAFVRQVLELGWPAIVLIMVVVVYRDSRECTARALGLSARIEMLEAEIDELRGGL